MAALLQQRAGRGPETIVVGAAFGCQWLAGRQS